jgi:hypothetical protein
MLTLLVTFSIGGEMIDEAVDSRLALSMLRLDCSPLALREVSED